MSEPARVSILLAANRPYGLGHVENPAGEARRENDLGV